MVPLYLLTMASQPAVLDVLAMLYVLAGVPVLYVLCVQQLLREWPMSYYQSHLFLSHAVVSRC